MPIQGNHEPATEPDELPRFFLERANAGDVEGLVALYEPEALLASPSGPELRGHVAIREFYTQLLANTPSFTVGEQRPLLRTGDTALTSTRLPAGGATAEVARRQLDGTWLWIIDQPNVLA